jgi:hypothetical protein
MTDTFDRIKQIILTTLETSEQFTPEQRDALAQAITAGIAAFQDELQADVRPLKSEHTTEPPEQFR